MAELFDGIFPGQSGITETLLGILGTTAAVQLPSLTVYDPATGADVITAGSQITVKSAPPELYSIDEIDGSNIITGDIKVTIGAYDLGDAGIKKEQLQRSTLIINDDNLTIVTASPVFSGKIIASYELQLRR